MKNFFGIAAFFAVFALIFSGCAGMGSGKATQPFDVFQDGTFENGASLSINDLVSIDGNKISVSPVIKEDAEAGWEYTVLIQFNEPVKISGYSSLYMDWEGIYSGDLGGVSLNCAITTSNGKVIDIGGGWSQRNGSNEKKQDLYTQYFPFSATLTGGEKDNQVKFSRSLKDCVSIEISSEWGMRAGDERENWNWFGLKFEELKPLLIKSLYFTSDPGPKVDFQGSGK